MALSLRVDFEDSENQSSSSVPPPPSLPTDQSAELSATAKAPCLPLCHHAPGHDDDVLNL